MKEGLFEENLPEDVTLETTTFNAGPEAVEALFAGDLDITYIGPNPAINAYAQSDGEEVRIIAGSTSGAPPSSSRDGIDTVEDLAGTTMATPQLGNTQDVALRSFLADNGYETDEPAVASVSIQPANADSLAAFNAGDDRRRLGARALRHPLPARGRRPRARRRGRPLDGRATS